ncbi:unnamed protein product [Vitrella brassicaformis CCMP3155]|uniref:Uncharacterized protein n=1 Tax=Vitrella brassicaformis (strain CCMP3155) TaxID=1169540 RepID=A0A0G4G348_VITBC|nr:unnamed protein product [Vitrella brassicaformis CCMP3155]|eukprot:CEM22525.1 unnamed protein product [Vitrella brassicaformis CCMP3155]
MRPSLSFPFAGCRLPEAPHTVLLTDAGNNAILVCSRDDGTLSCLHGKQWKQPAGIAVFSDTSAVVADSGHHRIKILEMASEGRATGVRVLAGAGHAGYRDGPARDAWFHTPTGLCVVKETSRGCSRRPEATDGRMVLVADSGNSCIRYIKRGIDGQWTVGTLAGSTVPGSIGGLATHCRFGAPSHILPLRLPPATPLPTTDPLTTLPDDMTLLVLDNPPLTTREGEDVTRDEFGCLRFVYRAKNGLMRCRGVGGEWAEGESGAARLRRPMSAAWTSDGRVLICDGSSTHAKIWQLDLGSRRASPLHIFIHHHSQPEVTTPADTDTHMSPRDMFHHGFLPLSLVPCFAPPPAPLPPKRSIEARDSSETEDEYLLTGVMAGVMSRREPPLFILAPCRPLSPYLLQKTATP